MIRKLTLNCVSLTTKCHGILNIWYRIVEVDENIMKNLFSKDPCYFIKKSILIYIYISDATVWKLESRFGFRFSSSRYRNLGFWFSKKINIEIAASVCSCSSFNTAHCIVSPWSENNKNN